MKLLVYKYSSMSLVPHTLNKIKNLVILVAIKLSGANGGRREK
jgi:hypothetical protein